MNVCMIEIRYSEEESGRFSLRQGRNVAAWLMLWSVRARRVSVTARCCGTQVQTFQPSWQDMHAPNRLAATTTPGAMFQVQEMLHQ